MKRSFALKSLVHFYESIPDEASSEHKIDMLLSCIERLGLKPPLYKKGGTNYTPIEFVNEWEPENNTCKDCGIETGLGAGSARCSDCWDDRFGDYDD